jgi:hypothetical protein
VQRQFYRIAGFLRRGRQAEQERGGDHAGSQRKSA